MAGDLARHAGESLLKSCAGDAAAVEGLSRLLRNAQVMPEASAEGGFAATVRRAQGCGRLLAVADTTSLSYRHGVVEELGLTGSRAESSRKGFMVHSVLLLDGSSGATVGLLEQRRWMRAVADYVQKHARQGRAYEDKESFKWQQAVQRCGDGGASSEWADDCGVRSRSAHQRIPSVVAGDGWALCGACGG